MKKIRLSLSLILLFATLSLSAQVGTWRAFPAYSNVTQIEKVGHTLYVLASGGLYAYNTQDRSIVALDKATTLSDADIRKMAWCEAAKRLVVVYNNGNIDLVSPNGTTINMPEYYKKSMTEDKTVNDIYIYNEYAYISTNFGVIKLHVGKAEISDTYMLYIPIHYTYIQGEKIHAASMQHGIYAASLKANLLDKSVWVKEQNYIDKDRTVDPSLLETVASLNPGGPKHNHFGVLRFAYGKLYTAGGGYTEDGDDNRDGTIQVWDGSNWQIYDSDIASKTGHLYEDIMEIDVDPRDPDHLMAGSRGGLYEFKNGQFVKEWSYDNSLLQSTFSTDKNYVIVKGVKYDAKGNLWILNSNNRKESILTYTADNQWESKHQPELMQEGITMRHLTKVMTDSRNLLWFVNSNWLKPAVITYQPANGGVQVFSKFTNQDGASLTIAKVHCVTEDLQGNMWIGTNMGPLMLRPDGITQAEPVFYQTKIPRNDGTNLADYLLSGVNITAIAIDGAGRKWMGTNGNGVYLISEDNLTQVQHFTSENSPLLSDVIEAIAIDPNTGEVFFGTLKGLCSYKSDAVNAQEEMSKETVWAYPNPVTPEYNGMITVTGLTLDADVKIVTANGSLVTEGRSRGGLFTWDGNDRQGRRVASGVYMVLSAKADGSKGTVCKIAVVN